VKINRDEKVLALTYGLGERAKYVYVPSSKLEGADYGCQGGGGSSLNRGKLLTLVASANKVHSIFSQAWPAVTGTYSRNCKDVAPNVRTAHPLV